MSVLTNLKVSQNSTTGQTSIDYKRYIYLLAWFIQHQVKYASGVSGITQKHCLRKQNVGQGGVQGNRLP